MLEDDIYRTSTQYRLWSFTEDSLRSIRANTNAVASERVRAAVRRAREARQQSTAAPAPDQGTPNPTPSDGERAATPARTGEIECLTPEEEFELVQYYCEKTMELGDEYKPPLPTTVRATAIQYLRRFYLTNSPMTYHPKSIMPCALFIATKTDNFYMSLRSFTEHIPNSTMENIIAPEFLLTQGLRFTFDVRHPFRGLEGGMMELNAIAKGEATPGPHQPGHTVSGLQKAMQSLPPPPPSIAGPVPATPLSTRLAKVHHNTREVLKHSVQMTDVYFLYTPSQIWLSALLLVDKPLAKFYLETKLGPPSPSTSSSSASPSAMLSALHAKLTPVLQSCCAILTSYIQNNGSSNTAPDPTKMKRLKQIGKKLFHCQNPEREDLVALNKLQKQGGSATHTGANTPSESTAATASASAGGGDDQAVESDIDRAAKKRKLEREKFESEKDSIFGGELGK